MQQSTTPSLSQTIWPRWVSRQFVILVIVQTLFSNDRDCRYETIEEMKDVVTKDFDTLTQEDSHGHPRSCWNGTTSALQPKGITWKGDYSTMCVLSIKVPIRKSLETYLMILVHALLRPDKPEKSVLNYKSFLKFSFYFLNLFSVNLNSGLYPFEQTRQTRYHSKMKQNLKKRRWTIPPHGLHYKSKLGKFIKVMMS